MSKVMKLHFDGGCKPNPGRREVAVVALTRPVPQFYHDRVGYGTNNEAEWIALLWALDLAKKAGARRVHLLGDSLLVIKQAMGEWRCKKDNLKPYVEVFREMQADFEDVKVEYIPRRRNYAGRHIEGLKI